jgi:3-hydroxybutyryl-CoA dehydrogenase
VNIAVLGTGMMGPGIAVGMAQAGHAVAMYGRSQASVERGLAAVGAIVGLLASADVIPRVEAEQVRARVRGTTDLRDAVSAADVVVESIVENLETKQQVFEEVERYVGDDTILTSNTSGLPISRIAARLHRPERAVTTHFWNPPHLMPLVDLVKGERTEDNYVLRMRTLLREAGWSPVLLTRDVPGQLGNRLQHAVYREAFHIIQEGIASPEDVDIAIKNGPGLRWPVYGLMEHADMVGLDGMDAIDSYLFADLAVDKEPGPALRERIARGDLGVKTGRGFLEWTEERASAVRATRDKYLLERLKERRAAQQG